MTPKRKRLYIILICVCFVLSAAILFWGYSGSKVPSAASDPNNTAYNGVSAENTTGGIDYTGSGFPTPSVFPATNKFNTAVLDSSAFKKLQPYTPLDVTGQLGRPDPFNHY